MEMESQAIPAINLIKVARKEVLILPATLFAQQPEERSTSPKWIKSSNARDMWKGKSDGSVGFRGICRL